MHIPSLVDDFVLVELLVALESIDNDIDAVVDPVVVAVVTCAAVSCGNQISFLTALQETYLHQFQSHQPQCVL